METMQMRARRAANPDSRNSETRKGRWQALGSPKGARAAGGHWGVEEGRMQSAGAARGQARLQIGEGPGCVSGPSVQPGIMPLVPLVPLVRLPPHISYMTKKARAVSGAVEWGNLRL